MRDEGQRQERLLADQAARASRAGLAVAGRFIPDADRGDAVHAARVAGVLAAFDGGYEQAERIQVCFYPEGEEPAFTGQWSEIRWNPRFAAPDHRALMGSLMALGVDRSYMGDLIAGEERAWLYCLPNVAARLPTEWHEAGRVAIRVETLDAAPALTISAGTILRDTVPSLRLDAVLSAGLRESRANAAERIRRGDVDVNHRREERVDQTLRTGDLLSIHGFGRIRLRAVDEPNRRGRLPVELECFLRK